MNSEIWAFGGGKGGTGKSFVTSTMGIHLAQKGKRVILIDGDWGGPNLHSFLRLKKPRYSLTDFFEKRIPLSEIIRETNIPNMRFITGDIRSLDASGPKHVQKLKLYRHIKNLNCDYVLIDLGAGSFHNTIDTFLIADRMIAVFLPEVTAIENLYVFIKKVLFRRLNHLLGEHGLKDAAKNAWIQRKTNDIKNIKDLINHIKTISPQVEAVIEKAMGNFRLHLVMNQLRDKNQIDTGASTCGIIRKYFGIETLYAGYIQYSDFFWRLINESQNQWQITSPASTSQQVAAILHNLVEAKEIQH